MLILCKTNLSIFCFNSIAGTVFNKDDDKANELKMAYLFKSVISEERYFAELGNTVDKLCHAVSEIGLNILVGRFGILDNVVQKCLI